MAKSNAGRPTVMTKDTIDKLEYVFALGGTDAEACLFANISTDALYKYQRENPEYIKRKQALRETPILEARTEVVKGLKGNPEFSLKYLERKKKDEFSLRQEITGEDGKELIVKLIDYGDGKDKKE